MGDINKRIGLATYRKKRFFLEFMWPICDNGPLMKQHTSRNLAVLFADVSGSTQLFEKVGDRKARAAIAATLRALSKLVREGGGKIVKTIGDEIMCVFATPNRAANTACKMQETVEHENPAQVALGEDLSLRIRIGFHFGPTLIERGDVFGDSVNVAARMAAQAKGGQIITTHATVRLLDDKLQQSSRFVDNAPVKGKREVMKIYELIWQEEDMTHMASFNTPAVTTSSIATLKVKYHQRLLEITPEHPKLVMGRSQSCDLPIEETLASRQHASFELRRDKFYIIDQSTNGTFVQVENMGETFLRREEMPIRSGGRLSLGRSFEEKPTEIVLFKTVQSHP